MVSLYETLKADGKLMKMSGKVPMTMSSGTSKAGGPKAQASAPRGKNLRAAPPKVRRPRGQLRGGANEGEGAYPMAEEPTLLPYETAYAYVMCTLDPFDEPPAHQAELGATCPSELAKQGPNQLNLTIANGTTAADGSVALLFRGDLINTVYLPASISAAHAITWAGGTGYNNYSPYTSSYQYRATSYGYRLTLFTAGDTHSVLLSSIRLLPGSTATMYGRCPTSTNVCTTAVQKRDCDGMDRVMENGDSFTFVSSAAISRSWAVGYSAVATDRGVAGLEGWGVWLYGLTSTDRVTLEYVANIETISTETTPVVASNVSTVVNTANSLDVANAMQTRIANSALDTPVSKAGNWRNIIDSVKANYSGILKSVSVADKIVSAMNKINSFIGLPSWLIGKGWSGPVMVNWPKGIDGLDFYPHPDYLRKLGWMMRAQSILRRPALPLSETDERRPSTFEEVEHKDAADDFPRVAADTPRLSAAPRSCVVSARASSSSGRPA